MVSFMFNPPAFSTNGRTAIEAALSSLGFEPLPGYGEGQYYSHEATASDLETLNSVAWKAGRDLRLAWGA